MRGRIDGSVWLFGEKAARGEWLARRERAEKRDRVARGEKAAKREWAARRERGVDGIGRFAEEGV